MKSIKLYSTQTTELIPMNGRKSFYGKAKVVNAGGWTFLKSYDTIMCGISPSGEVHRYSDYKSHTTYSHLISFLGEDRYYCGFWKLPCEEKPTIYVTF